MSVPLDHLRNSRGQAASACAARALLSAARTLSRRALLKAAVCAGLALNLTDAVRADDVDVRAMRPEVGDVLVFANEATPRKMIRVPDLPVGGAPVFAWPMDPRTGIVRDGTRLNRLLVLRLDPAKLSAVTRAHAADGVVAYSAVCTHEGCPVTEWLSQQRVLQCPCHGSQYDPADVANVVKGPTLYRLANLPLRKVDGALVVAGKFIGRLGAQGA